MAPVLRASSSFGSASLCPGASTLRQGHIVAKVPARRQSINPLAAKVVVPELGKIGSPEFEAIRNGTFKWSGEVFKKYKEKFQPVTKKPEVPVILDFEKPLFALENKIKEVKRAAEESGLNVDDQVAVLEKRAEELRLETYTRLTAPQKLQVARHPQRPTFLDIMCNICDNFMELHGDRAGYDDPAIVCGLAKIDGVDFIAIGQQKGRNTKENVYRNFGMPQPNGYRKAMRYMRMAEHFGWPIITFIDTPGAFAGKTAEDLGQGEAIAYNLREMFGIRVPIISTVIGEGGSGGALAIGCSNHRFIMQNAVYFVASPEACASILWKDRSKVNLAATVLKITAPDLLEFGVMDEVIPEPLGGSHNNPPAVYPNIKKAIMDLWHNKYSSMACDEIVQERYSKYRTLGMWSEFRVYGLQYQQEKLRRATAEGCFTDAGTWCVDEEERERVMKEADQEEAFRLLLEDPDRAKYLNPPMQPPGLQDSGIMEVAIAAMELKLQYNLDAAREAIVARREAQLEDRLIEDMIEAGIMEPPPAEWATQLEEEQAEERFEDDVDRAVGGLEVQDEEEAAPPVVEAKAEDAEGAVPGSSEDTSGAGAPGRRSLERRKSTRRTDGELFFASDETGNLMRIEEDAAP